MCGKPSKRKILPTEVQCCLGAQTMSVGWDVGNHALYVSLPKTLPFLLSSTFFPLTSSPPTFLHHVFLQPMPLSYH